MTIDYRGASVEDLDLPPALTVYPSTTLHSAFDMSYEREFSYLPVISQKNKRLLGYLTAEQLQNAASTIHPDSQELVKNHYNKFFGEPQGSDSAKSKRTYEPITLSTPLEKLEEFFARGEEFAVVTDEAGKFVLGVVVKEDLDKYVKSRPILNA